MNPFTPALIAANPGRLQTDATVGQEGVEHVEHVEGQADEGQEEHLHLGKAGGVHRIGVERQAIEGGNDMEGADRESNERDREAEAKHRGGQPAFLNELPHSGINEGGQKDRGPRGLSGRRRRRSIGHAVNLTPHRPITHENTACARTARVSPREGTLRTGAGTRRAGRRGGRTPFAGRGRRSGRHGEGGKGFHQSGGPAGWAAFGPIAFGANKNFQPVAA